MEKKKYDYRKLRGKIKEVLGSENLLAQQLELSNASISAKLNSNIYFSIDEIDRIIDLLKIPQEEVYDYFFTQKVEKIQPIEEGD